MAELPPGPDDGVQAWTLHCEPGFVPARAQRGSRDERTLAFQLTALECPP